MAVSTTSVLRPRGISAEKLGANRARVVVEPLERGYGHTLGNALRRVLLSSIPGAVITEVEIDGVLHEYTSLEGLQEDVIEVLLNLKDVAIRMHNVEETTLTLSKKGSGVVKAGDMNFVGQWWLRQWDRILSNIPIVKSIYTSVKQVSDTLFSSSGQAFREAVLVEYPRRDCWTIAFVTGKPGGEVAEQLHRGRGDDDEFVSLYVPTTPNPTSGFFLMAPRADVRPLQMSVDEALKYIISMGVVAPPATPH